jgi:hypothetical protein
MSNLGRHLFAASGEATSVQPIFRNSNVSGWNAMVTCRGPTVWVELCVKTSNRGFTRRLGNSIRWAFRKKLATPIMTPAEKISVGA